MTEESSKQVYYGWKVVIALLVILTFTSGLSFYNHAVYLNALAAKDQFDVGNASMAVSIFFLSGGIAGLWVARWVQEYDPRICISVGAILSFVSLTALPLVETVPQLWLVYALFGTGFSAAGLIPATTLVTRWFQRKRAVALSIASTGLSLGGVVLTPLSVLLIESLGFGFAAPAIGVVYLLGVIPVAWIWLRPEPQAMGLAVDGEAVAATVGLSGSEENTKTPDAMDRHADEHGISFKEARRGRFFWGVSLAYIFLMMAQVGGIAHQYGLARELLTESQTAIAVAILPVASIVGRLVGGWAVGQISIRAFAIGMMVLQALSLSLLSGGFNIVSLCVGLFLFGTSVGNLLMLQPLLIAEAFGVKEYARIFSVNNLMSSWGTAIGPALMGFVYTANNSQYSLPYLVVACAGGLGLLLFLFGGKLRNH